MLGRVLLTVGAGIALVLGALIAFIGLTYSGGEPYPDLSTEPALSASALETVVTSERAIGNVAVSAGGRVFYTIHPESQPKPPFLMEWVDGAPAPLLPTETQADLFQSPLGLVVDAQNRLWVIDPGAHGSGTPKLVAIDLSSGTVAHEHAFPSAIAPAGSFLQDLAVSLDGKTVFIADASFWRRDPSIVVYDVESQTARALLVDHPSVSFQNWKIRTPIKDMVFFGGLVSLKVGIDGIALDRTGEWIHYASMSHDTAYRVRVADLRDEALTAAELATRIEAIGPKPLSDGISVDREGGTLITAIEEESVVRLGSDGSLETIIRSPSIRWADGLSFGPDGYLYLADSAIPHQMLQSQAHIAENAPYFVYRFKPSIGAPAGH